MSATVTIRKSWAFSAAHRLPHHGGGEGKCARPHGHTYGVEVEVEGHPQPVDGRSEGGMVLDFARLDEAWAPLHARLDHRDLNEVLRGVVPATTSELLAAWLLARFRDALEEPPDVTSLPIYVRSVTVSESPATSATAR